MSRIWSDTHFDVYNMLQTLLIYDNMNNNCKPLADFFIMIEFNICMQHLNINIEFWFPIFVFVISNRTSFRWDLIKHD